MDILNRLPLNGYKTIIAGLLAIVYGISGYFTGNLETASAVSAIVNGLAILGIRHAIEKNRPQ